MILAIDPGPVESAILCLSDNGVAYAEKLPNSEVRLRLLDRKNLAEYELCIEMIASYGMPVGKEVFETCVWIGRFWEAWGRDCLLVPRLNIKTHLCHSAKAKDANVRQALIDRLGVPGTKKNPGPTYGIAGDMWAALALAVYAKDAAEVKA